ncbi:MAG: hypothetical protein HQL67_07555 [Magnetococcales bacterium]|nr:hypothetical protein [Magnetococcales bacterium]
MTTRKEVIATKNAPQAVGSYSQAIKSEEWLFLSGQIGLNPLDAIMVEGGVEKQTEQIMKNLQAILQEAGGGCDDLLKVTIYLVDLTHFQAVDAIYARYLKAPYPARATVGVAALPKEALVEMDAVARIKQGFSGFLHPDDVEV